MLITAVDTYLAVRRAAGFQLADDTFYLYQFVRFASALGDTHVASQTAISWAGQAHSESQRATRLKMVIRFARFSHAADHNHEIPPDGVFCFRRQRPTPYLYTEAEIQALMAATAQLGPASSFRPLLYRTLIGLLASTGLRISEALGLRFKDIMADGLLIHQTKFGKSRIVPLHPTTRAALDEYLAERGKLVAVDDHLFISMRRRRMCRKAIYKTFKELLSAAGLPRQPGQPRPRLIDFRHSFASNALVAVVLQRFWSKELLGFVEFHGQSEQLVNKSNLRYHIILRHTPYSSLSEHVHGFDSLDRAPSRAKGAVTHG